MAEFEKTSIDETINFIKYTQGKNIRPSTRSPWQFQNRSRGRRVAQNINV